MAVLPQYILVCLFYNFHVWADLNYHERLDLTPLPSSLLASFNFRSTTSLQAFEQQHFRYVPRSLGHVLQHAKTRELHLRFSTGRWDDESWGARPWQGTKEGGTGVELWAWVDADNEEEAFARWITFNNALSGLFCASLNFIDSTRTTRPVMSFEPMSDRLNSSISGLYLLHGILPHEVVCTENLTPFLKLLPCKGKSGISTLLDGHKLFDASYQTMAIDIRNVCAEGSDECSVEMDQTIDMVLDIERSKRPRDNPIPRPVPSEQLICDQSKSYASPDTCWPADTSVGQSWTLREIFGRQLKGSCLATDSQGQREESVCLHVPHERGVYISGGAIERKDPSGNSRCFTLPESDFFEMALPQEDGIGFSPRTQPRLTASRSITGYGQERGGIQTLLINPSPTDSIFIVYFESLPWFMKPYLHTLQVQRSTSTTPEPRLIKSTYYRPALDRQRGTQLECMIEVPPATTLILTYDFDKAILRYTEYPPDANRGFDVAPAVIRLLPSHHATLSPATSKGSIDNDEESAYIRTTTLLLPLPTPDFSMPYNVIILTSTVMALAFGSIFNFLVRRFVGADEAEGWDLGAVKTRIRERIKSLVGRIKGEGSLEQAAKEEEKAKKVQ